MQPGTTWSPAILEGAESSFTYRTSKVGPFMLDAIEHSVLWRIEDAARVLGSPILSNMTFGRPARSKQERRQQMHESATAQLLSRMLPAHSAIEGGLKHLIKNKGRAYSYTHSLDVLLQELRECDAAAASSLDHAFAATIEFYDTDTQDPDYPYLTSLSDYLKMTGSQQQFELMRYLELESSIDDPALEYMHVEFHYEILKALSEILFPRYGTIHERVERAAREAFLSSHRLETLASHSEASKEAYIGWFEDQPSFMEALRSLTSRVQQISDDDVNQVAVGVCYDLTGCEDLALRIVASELICSEPSQPGGIETCAWRVEGSKNRIVTTPGGNVLGYMRRLPTGSWLATDDVHNTNPAWCRTESDARLYLAWMFLIVLQIITERGSSSYHVLSNQPFQSPHERRWCASDRFNWAEFGTDKMWLKFWDPHQDLRPDDQIAIRPIIEGADEDPISDLYWCGRVEQVAGQDVHVGEVQRQRSPCL